MIHFLVFLFLLFPTGDSESDSLFINDDGMDDIKKPTQTDDVTTNPQADDSNTITVLSLPAEKSQDSAAVEQSEPENVAQFAK